MALNREALQTVVDAENARLNRIDVEKARVRLEEIGSLKKQQKANTREVAERNEKLQERIEKIQAELVALELNEVTVADAVGNATVADPDA